MKILFVYPKYPDTFWSFKSAIKYISKKAAYAPLGMLTVASMLPKTWEKKLVDINVKNLKDEDILWADYVFIGAMLAQQKSAKEVIQRAKALGKKVAAGGPAFTTSHDKFEGIDHLILNEAEITLPLFIKDAEKGEAKPIYTSEEKPDVTKSPIPDWSLVNVNDYATMSLQYSRGCPFNCEFCDIIIMNGRIPRTKTPEQVIAELEAIYATGWREGVFIVDDNFIGKKGETKKMLRELIKWQEEKDFPFTFFTEASTNLADDKELMELMSKANFNKVFLGIETPDKAALEECAKYQNKRDLVETVRTIQNHGMQVMGGFIVGFDNDTEHIFDTQIKFIQEMGIVTAMVGLLSALPKTRLWNRLKSEGRLVEHTTGENTDGTMNFEPKMGKEKLIAGYKKIMGTIYSPKHYYRRVRQLIKHYKPTAKQRITKHALLAFFRSIWKIGILSKDSPQYWYTIIVTLFTRIKAFPMVIELAIHRQHFENVVKRYL